MFILDRDNTKCNQCLDCEEHLEGLNKILLNGSLFISEPNVVRNLIKINAAIVQCKQQALRLREY
jgi:hypothetical protein